jgi:peptidyl-prolyl cis-trans isomerase SurA
MQINKTVVTLLILLNGFTLNVFPQDKIIDQVVAVVGSNVILKSEIEDMYLQYQAQGMTSEGDMKCEILENLLVEKLMVAEAELDTTIIVTDNQINQSLDDQIKNYVQHLGSEKAVEEHFNKPIVQLKADMKDMVKNQILTQQMQRKIIENVKVTPSEVRYYYRNLPDSEKPKVNTQYEYSQITIIPKIDEKEEERVKDELRELKKRAENGENFAMFAVLYSECPSAKDGGDLGYFGRATMDPAFSAAAFNLKPNQISNVVRSESGYHIIQMIDRKGEKIRCRHILIKPKVDPTVKQQAFNALDSLANDIRRGKVPFEDAAMRLSMDKNSRNNGGLVLNPYTMSSKFEPDMLPPEVSKVLDKLKINEISTPFQAVDDKQRDVYEIVKLNNKTPAHLATLTDDYQLISDMYLNKKKEETVQKWIAERQAKNYIRIDDTYANCDFKFKNWIK